MRAASERGQVIVEQAIILPMMVFLILGILQLAMLQHARIATEYAAFNAARAGIVYNADEDQMAIAAFWSLFPTYGRSDSWSAIFDRFKGQDMQMRLLSFLMGELGDMLGVNGVASEAPMVRVKVLENPDLTDGWGGAFDNFGKHLNKEQIDFDDWRQQASKLNVLSIEVRYLYMMRVPFANWMLQDMWLAQRLGTLSQYGGVNFVAPEVEGVMGVGAGAMSARTLTKAAAVASMEDEILAVMAWRFIKRKNGEPTYVFPIRTWYSMRMQSNIYRSNVGG